MRGMYQTVCRRLPAGRTILALLLVLCMLPACTSLRPVSLSGVDPQEQLKPGDRIRVTTHQGAVLEFELAEALSDRLIGSKDEVVAITDILEIGRREPSRAKTTGLIVVVVAGAVVALWYLTAVAIADSIVL